jgi:chemotaxis protein MotA
MRYKGTAVGVGTPILIILGLVSLVLLFLTVGIAWLNLPGLVLVAGGTIVAAVISHSRDAVTDLLKRIPELLRESDWVPAPEYDRFIDVVLLHHRGEVRSAENVSTRIPDRFLREGARLALDPHNSEELGRVLQWQLRQQKERDIRDIRILRAMATFAPAFGMLGTIVGLVTMLGTLGRVGVDTVGLSLGFALMSTLYGLVAANLLFRPLSLKLEDRARQRLMHMNAMYDAIMMLHGRQHPLVILDYLKSISPSSTESSPVQRGPGDRVPGDRVSGGRRPPLVPQRLRA